MIIKLRYHPEVRRVLLATGSLKLKTDHPQKEECMAQEWKDYQLWMDIGRDLGTKYA